MVVLNEGQSPGNTKIVDRTIAGMFRRFPYHLNGRIYAQWEKMSLSPLARSPARNRHFRKVRVERSATRNALDTIIMMLADLIRLWRKHQ
jgi:hypothetical protein